MLATRKLGDVLTRLFYKSFLIHPLAEMLGGFLSVKCYGSTAVSKTASRGSTPCTDATGYSTAW